MENYLNMKLLTNIQLIYSWSKLLALELAARKRRQPPPEQLQLVLESLNQFLSDYPNQDKYRRAVLQIQERVAKFFT
jgi:hypothetical protein